MPNATRERSPLLTYGIAAAGFAAAGGVTYWLLRNRPLPPEPPPEEPPTLGDIEDILDQIDSLIAQLQTISAAIAAAAQRAVPILEENAAKIAEAQEVTAQARARAESGQMTLADVDALLDLYEELLLLFGQNNVVLADIIREILDLVAQLQAVIADLQDAVAALRYQLEPVEQTVVADCGWAPGGPDCKQCEKANSFFQAYPEAEVQISYSLVSQSKVAWFCPLCCDGGWAVAWLEDPTGQRIWSDSAKSACFTAPNVTRSDTFKKTLQRGSYRIVSQRSGCWTYSKITVKYLIPRFLTT